MSFIKLDRKILGWKWYGNNDTFKLWVHLLLTAEYEDTMRDGVMVRRGQVKTGRRRLAQETNMSEQQIRNQLINLQKTNEITIKTTNKYSLITILKYEEYQGRHQNSTNKPTNKNSQKQPTNQPTYIYKEEVKEDKNIRNIYIDRLPVYDPSKNTVMTDEEEQEILTLMGRA